MLQKFLGEHGFDVTVARTGQQALDYARRSNFQLMVLDLMLPDMDGIDVCRRTRELDFDIRILMLTARGDVPDRIVGLELGADD